MQGDPRHLLLAHLFDKPCFLGLLAVKVVIIFIHYDRIATKFLLAQILLCSFKRLQYLHHGFSIYFFFFYVVVITMLALQ